jgi:hypothetical protein
MRPQTPVPLTLEEHAELGRELRQNRLRLHELCSVIVDVYGANNRAAFTFRKVIESMDRLAGDMEAQAAADHPGNQVAGLYS